jgi:hypothetical protein
MKGIQWPSKKAGEVRPMRTGKLALACLGALAYEMPAKVLSPYGAGVLRQLPAKGLISTVGDLVGFLNGIYFTFVADINAPNGSYTGSGPGFVDCLGEPILNEGTVQAMLVLSAHAPT